MRSRSATKRPGDADWTWRNKYRVWEPTRKVFLYPENWIEPEAGLRPGVRASLREIEDFIRAKCEPEKPRSFARKKGVHVLLVGGDRTAAVVAAQSLARALDLNLYRIDLSGLLSKYIGETEKNLRRLFDLAQKDNAVLFFDEANALFGRRSKVKDSHDRYANTEVNYLLRRIEEYSGLALLTVASKVTIDPAFSRVFPFRIAFTPPRGREGPLEAAQPEAR